MIKYFIKYYLYNGSTKLFKSSFILPFLTVIVGCFVMMMSFAIMEGFSKKISDSIYFFDKKYSLKINKKEFLSYYKEETLDSLINFLVTKDYFFSAYEDRIMFLDSNNEKLVAKVYGVTDFNNFNPNKFLLNNFTSNINYANDDYLPDCYLGYNQSLNLNLIPNETLTILSILDFKNTNSFPKKKFNIKGIIKTNLPRYDNSIFIPFDSILFSKNIFLNINLNKKINKEDLSELDHLFNKGVIYDENTHLFSDLLYAMNYEKFFYALFGLFIVSISSLMLMGFNISSIIRNSSSIGLLKSLGLKKKYISFFYIVYALFIGIMGFFISFLLFLILLMLDYNYQLMDYIFNPNIYFSFDLILSIDILVKIFLLSVVLILLSTLYPLYKISKLDIIDSIKSRS